VLQTKVVEKILLRVSDKSRRENSSACETKVVEKILLRVSDKSCRENSSACSRQKL